MSKITMKNAKVYEFVTSKQCRSVKECWDKHKAEIAQELGITSYSSLARHMQKVLRHKQFNLNGASHENTSK